VLPPTPPERGGGSRRIRIEIEIIDHRAPPRGYRFGTPTLWLLVLGLELALPYDETSARGMFTLTPCRSVRSIRNSTRVGSRRASSSNFR
jgi:hypothetical protein